MDADVRLAPDALARMVSFMWRQASVPAVAGGFQPPESTVRTAGDSPENQCASTQTTLSPPGWKPGSTAGRDARRYVALASGVPRQELGTFSERLLLPLIHFVLLGYLPMFMMRWTRRAGFSAGCGQLFIAQAEAYHASGGHSAIRATLHDGVKLPRAFRRAGFQTDLLDATDIATCRMYHPKNVS